VFFTQKCLPSGPKLRSQNFSPTRKKSERGQFEEQDDSVVAPRRGQVLIAALLLALLIANLNHAFGNVRRRM
jgi:hypothetical protein